MRGRSDGSTQGVVPECGRAGSNERADRWAVIGAWAVEEVWHRGCGALRCFHWVLDAKPLLSIY